MAKEIFRFLIGISIIGLIVYAIVNHKGSSYSSDGSDQEAILDQIEADKIDEFKYQNSLQGKYENNEKDTSLTDNGDMVIFYVTTDTIKNPNNK